MLDGVAGRIILGRYPGPAPLDCWCQKRQPAAVTSAEPLERLQKAAQRERHGWPLRSMYGLRAREDPIIARNRHLA
jgi:hypothetical protein